MDWTEALELSEEIVRTIDEDVPEWAIDKATDFFEDIRAKAVSIGETIEKHQRCSDKQVAALESWESAVRKWVR